jgi:hypothetical protein
MNYYCDRQEDARRKEDAAALILIPWCKRSILGRWIFLSTQKDLGGRFGEEGESNRDKTTIQTSALLLHRLSFCDST